MIRITDLDYVVGAFRLRITLEVSDGEYFVLLGPTGSGKTAAIECLAGLRRPRSGRIEISGWDATRAEPRRRMVGYVPQDYALFMRRSVRRNIGFGPEVRGRSRAEIGRAVEEAARLVGIEKLLDRRIPGLSGGERQRVALARALATRPEALILDEPVSALDEATRETVCGELRRLQRELKLTTIHVSHNIEEAFSVADRAAVMRNGRIEQVGRMEELLRRPRNEFVARFMRCENVFVGRAIGPGPSPDTTRVRVGDADVIARGRREGAILFVVRPENLAVRWAGLSSAPERDAAALPARLARWVDRGAYVRMELSSFQPLVAHLSAEAFAALMADESSADLEAVIPPEAIHVLEG
ncbi:MAG: ATP-binding cassette domain-containing protein [Verrucomicrobiota bacterium]|nr:ATP-binding cassette domain-containing protein [Verrucomicrobiota bacterium]